MDLTLYLQYQGQWLKMIILGWLVEWNSKWVTKVAFSVIKFLQGSVLPQVNIPILQTMQEELMPPGKAAVWLSVWT